MDLAKWIRDVPDFPKKGIVFKDITPLLLNEDAFCESVERMAARYGRGTVDKIVAIESRGFIFAGAIAHIMGCGLVPVRKAGKLPWHTRSQDYSLEYGTNTVEIHEDALKENDRVVIVDDLLATGGTAAAAVRLVESMGAKVVGIEFLIELAFLGGRKPLTGYSVNSLIQY